MGTPYNLKMPMNGPGAGEVPSGPMPMMLPSGGAGPEPMRSPMAAVPSRMNHSYDGGMGFGTGLAGRAPVAKGRSGYDLDRIAERQFRQTGDPRMLQSQQWYHAQTDGRRGQADGQPVMMGPGTMPAGQGAPALPMNGTGMPAMSGPQAAAGPGPQAAAGPGLEMRPESQAPQPQQQPFSFPMPALEWDRKGPLPPSTLGGGTGVPAMGEPQGPEPFVPKPEHVREFGLQPDFSKTQVWSGKHYPTWRTATPKAEGWQLYDEPGPAVENPLTKKMEPGPMVKKQVNPATGETRDLIPAGGTRGPGGGGYNPFAKPEAKAAAQPAAAVPATAQAGPEGAGMQTGQMPNVAYANDMSPLQSLAAAREHYAQTGDDSKIRAHFQSNPSAAMQHLQRAQAADERGGQAIMDEEYQQIQSEKASQSRDRYLAQQGANAFTVGHHSAAWARANPVQALDLGDRQSFAKERTAALRDAQDAMADYGRQFEEDRKRGLAMGAPMKGGKP